MISIILRLALVLWFATIVLVYLSKASAPMSLELSVEHETDHLFVPRGKKKKRRTKAQRQQRREVLHRRRALKRARRLTRFCSDPRQLSDLTAILLESVDDLPLLNISYDGYQLCEPGYGGFNCSVTWSSWMPPPNTKVFEAKNEDINDQYISSIPTPPAVSIPFKAQTIADVGSKQGYGSIMMANSLHRYQQGGMVVAVDTWTGDVSDWTSNITLIGGHPHFYDSFYSNVYKSGLGNYVFPFATTPDTVSRFFRGVTNFDIVRVTQDGDYDLFEVVRTWWVSLKLGGRLQGGDYSKYPSLLQFAKSTDCILHVIPKTDEWFLTKTSSEKLCIPAYPEKEFNKGWDHSFECTNQSCNGGICDTSGPLERCRCSVGRGGQKCQISRSVANPSNPFFPRPASRFHSAETDGWNGGRESFEEIFKSNNFTTVIDVGVWLGKSSITMASLLREKGNGGMVISVDPWTGAVEHWKDYGPKWNDLKRIEKGFPRLFEAFRSNVIREGFQDYITPFPVASKTAAEIFKSYGYTADLIHIDASHDYESVLQNLRDWWPVVSPGGFIYGDDYSSCPEVRAAVDEFALNEIGIPLQFFGPGKSLPKTCVGCKFAIPKPIYEELEGDNDNNTRYAGVVVGDPSC